MQRVAVVSRWRRAGLIAGCLAFPLLASVGFMFGMRVYDKWQRSQPEIGGLAQVLNFRSAMHMPWLRNKPHPDDRTFAIYIASHYRQTITNAREWNTLYAVSTIAGENRKFAEQSLATYPNPTEKEINDATTAVKPLVPDARAMNFALKPWFPLVVFGASLLIYVCLPALLTALIFRSGLVLLACGVAVARCDGSRPSRLRIFWRSLVAWSPMILAPVLLAVLTSGKGDWIGPSLTVMAVIALATISLALPERGLPDRIAGTWLVPR
jgi:hypothetical protein